MKDVKKDILWRVYLVYLGVLVFSLGIIIKAAHIQFVEGTELRTRANQQEIKYFTIEASRGNILASDGSLLATSIPVFEIRMDVKSDHISDKLFYDKVDSLALCLSQLFPEKSKAAFKNGLVEARQQGNRYYLIQNNITYDELKELREFPIFRLGRYRGGLIVIRKSRRELPYQELARRTIGFENRNENIYVGLEGAFTESLSGQDGKELRRRINNGDWIPVADRFQVPPMDGKDILTTIDVNIQDVAESALMHHLEEHEAFQGCAVLMEVATGEIRAIANLRYDPEDGTYKEIYNYALGEVVEPGSTFKLASVIAALEDHKVRLDDRISVGNGVVRYYSQEMKDVHAFPGGVITVREAFEESSNVGISKIIYTHYKDNPEDYVAYLHKFRLHTPLETGIPGEGKPLIKDPSNKQYWYGTTLPWMSIGYEVLVSPLQMLTLYNAVANDGVMVRPTFVKAVQQGGQAIQVFGPEVLDSAICSQSTLIQVRSLLEGVVERGTGSAVKNEIYRVAGKTGTAQVADRNQGYNKKVYNASFIGYFPAENPKYSCIVVVNRPLKGKIYGGSVAAPVFKEIADKVYATEIGMQGPEKKPATAERLVTDTITGSNADLARCFATLAYPANRVNDSIDWVYTYTDKSLIHVKPLAFHSDTIPDLKGWSAKDAIYILEKMGLVPTVRGCGRVESQSISPGMPASRGGGIILNLTNNQS
jgi:cell division protein FtsI (penicillin-binding protein 3)